MSNVTKKCFGWNSSPLSHLGVKILDFEAACFQLGKLIKVSQLAERIGIDKRRHFDLISFYNK